MKHRKTICLSLDIWQEYEELVAKKQRRSMSSSIEQLMIRAIVATKREQLKREQAKEAKLETEEC